MSALTILTYHSIDDSGSVISVAPDTFGRQMDFLAERRIPVLSLEQAVRHLNERTPFPPGAVVVTFDDGFENNYTEAFPHLRRHGFPATVFLVVGHAGKNNDWPGQPNTIPRLPLLSWRQMAAMAPHGITFGAHTMTHPPLTEISAERARQEIDDSRSVLEQELGESAVPFFAYPYGAYSPALQQFVQSRFLGACSAKMGRVSARRSQPMLLERVDMYYLRDMRRFRLLARESAFKAYIAGRGLLRAARGAVFPSARPYTLHHDSVGVPAEGEVSA